MSRAGEPLLRRSPSQPLRGFFPSYQAFGSACRYGLSTVRPLKASALQSDDWGWNFGFTRGPSYWSYGRLRALITLNIASGLGSQRVLEIAAGDGALSACLQRPGCDVVVNDLRDEVIRASVMNFVNANDIRISAGNLFDLDSGKEGYFDTIIACELIEHVAEPLALLCKLKTFLTPNGRILLTTPNGAYFRNKLPTLSQITDRASLVAEQFKPDADGHLFLVTPEEMQQVAVDANLAIENFCVWGTPFISGECGLRIFRRILPTWLCFTLERMCARFPYFISRRLANSMVCILRERD